MERATKEIASAAPVGVTRVNRAVASWVDRGDPRPLRHWLEKELDPEGVPRRLPVIVWWTVLGLIDAARTRRPQGWPEEIDPWIEGLLRATLRFSRPDASSVFGEGHVPSDRGRLVCNWAKRLSDPALETVARWWFPRLLRGRRGHAAPPLPAHACADRPLAMLRADWSEGGDLVAVDARGPDPGCLLEVLGLGRRWLGPSWDVPPDAGPARSTFWTTGPHADLAEWSFRDGGTRVTRSALLLRGRRLALLAEQRDGSAVDDPVRIEIAPGVGSEPVAECRAIQLKSGRSSARVLPLGLPSLAYATERGSFAAENGHLVLRQAVEAKARRVWLPLLISWDPHRNRRPVRSRVLTVSEQYHACRPGVAFAVRVTWGTSESLLIYRSLARPGLRAFLGHQTRDRLLVGLFDRDGDVEPLLNVEG